MWECIETGGVFGSFCFAVVDSDKDEAVCYARTKEQAEVIMQGLEGVGADTVDEVIKVHETL